MGQEACCDTNPKIQLTLHLLHHLLCPLQKLLPIPITSLLLAAAASATHGGFFLLALLLPFGPSCPYPLGSEASRLCQPQSAPNAASTVTVSSIDLPTRRSQILAAKPQAGL